MITLYSKPHCTFCEKAKHWLTKNGIAFQAIDISIDEAAKEFIVAEGHKTVPQIYYNGKILVEGGYTGLSSYEPEQLKEMINDAAAKSL
jgi:glutaredoxin